MWSSAEAPDEGLVHRERGGARDRVVRTELGVSASETMVGALIATTAATGPLEAVVGHDASDALCRQCGRARTYFGSLADSPATPGDEDNLRSRCRQAT